MIRQILFELKVTFRSIKILIYIIFVFLYAITLFSGISSKDTRLVTYEQEITYQISRFHSLELNEIKEELLAGSSKKYIERKLHNSISSYEFYESVYLNLVKSGHLTLDESMFNDKEELLKIRENLGWEIKDYELSPHEINIVDNILYNLNHSKQEMKYNYALYTSGETLGTIYRVDAITALMHYSTQIVPNLAWIVAILILMDSMFRDFENGTIKMLITLPKDRSNYILVKIISSTLASIGVLLIPIAIIFVFLLFTTGLQSVNYPMLANLKGLTTLKPLFTYSPLPYGLENSNYLVDNYGIGQVVKGLYGWTYDPLYLNEILLKDPSYNLSVISLGSLLTLSLIPTLLSIIFFNCYGVMMAVFIRNRNAFIGGSVSLIIISILLELVSKGLNWSMFNPMNLNSGFALIEGIKYNTALSAIIFLPIYSLVCFVVASNRFKKLDIF